MVFLFHFSFSRFTYQRARFTCAAFHPLEACVAAGEGVGRIILW